MQGVITVNNAEAYVDACLAGLGLIQAPRTGVAPLLDDGSLVEVLPHLAAEPCPSPCCIRSAATCPAACAPSWIGWRNCWHRRWLGGARRACDNLRLTRSGGKIGAGKRPAK